jgi:hypothetical protein
MIAQRARRRRDARPAACGTPCPRACPNTGLRIWKARGVLTATVTAQIAAMAVVAAKARRGPVSGSQRIRRPVVAKVPPAVAIAMMSSGRTGMAARSAIRPVRQGLGWSSGSHQILHVIERHRLYRTTHGDPGVVNNGVQPFGQQLVQPGHVRLDRDVQLDWDYPLALGSKSASGLRIANAGEDVPASGSQMQRNGPANPASGTSDEDRLPVFICVSWCQRHPARGPRGERSTTRSVAARVDHDVLMTDHAARRAAALARVELRTGRPGSRSSPWPDPGWPIRPEAFLMRAPHYWSL